jgi:hypothetical protein
VEGVAVAGQARDALTCRLLEQRDRQLQRISASSVSASQSGRGTSSVKVHGPAAARFRTCSSSVGVAAVR